MIDDVTKEELYREINSFQNIETIIDILTSAATPLESEESSTAHGAKTDIVRQYVMSVDAYNADIAEQELEDISQQGLFQKAVNAFKQAVNYRIPHLFRNNVDEDVDYDELRNEHFNVSFLDSLMSRVEALSDVYETLKIIDYLDSKNMTDNELSKIIVNIEIDSIMPRLKSKIEASVTILKTIIDVPFDMDAENKITKITLDADDENQERFWILLASVNNALTLDVEGIEEVPMIQSVKFILPEQIKIVLYNLHSELGLIAGKYFYDEEYCSSLDSPYILAPETFNLRRTTLSETAQILYSLSDTILQNNFGSSKERTWEGRPQALRLH